MKEFEIGQKVRIVDNEVARDWSLYDLFGTEFVVEEHWQGEETTYNSYFVPAGACELVEDTINHSDMVAALAKPGADIQQELTAEDCHMLHMAVGISGEAGELLDAVKKAVIYRKPLDRENVIEEAGDIEFYLEGLRQGLGITREETIQANIAKLGKRYGEKYSDKAAQERADKRAA